MNCICLIKGHKIDKLPPVGNEYIVYCTRCNHTEVRLLAGKANYRPEPRKVNFDDFLRKLWGRK